MTNMIRMWRVTIKNHKTGEEALIMIHGHNEYQARRNAREANENLFTDPFAQITFEDIEYAGFEIPHP